MQITLDIPDDAYAKADAMARGQSRSLGSVITDLIRSTKAAPLPDTSKRGVPPGDRFPVVEGREVTQAEMDRLLEQDGLP